MSGNAEEGYGWVRMKHGRVLLYAGKPVRLRAGADTDLGTVRTEAETLTGHKIEVGRPWIDDGDWVASCAVRPPRISP